MKNLAISLLFLSFSFNLLSQTNEIVKHQIPSTDIKSLKGETINTSTFSNDDKPIIISFWATWCKPCIKEMNAIAEVYDDWREETGVKIIAISVDDARTIANVLPLVNGKGWEYEFYVDPNSDFKRAMNVNMVPHTFILNLKKEIVWQHTSFTEGGEKELIEIVRKINKGEDILSH